MSFRAILIIGSLFIIVGCTTFPECTLAPPNEGWRVIDSPPIKVLFEIPENEDAESEVSTWLQNEDGRVALCSRPKGIESCASSLSVAIPKGQGYEQESIIVTTCGMPY